MMSQILERSVHNRTSEQIKEAERLCWLANFGDMQEALSEFNSANCNEPDKKGWTPLMHAVVENRAQLVTRLLQLGARVNAFCLDGHQTLHIAAFFGSVDSARLLLAAGADVNCLGEKDRTPLMNSAWFGKPEMVRLLLINGADPNHLDRNGCNFERLAESVGAVDALREVQNWLSCGESERRDQQKEEFELLAKLKSIIRSGQTGARKQSDLFDARELNPLELEKRQIRRDLRRIREEKTRLAREWRLLIEEKQNLVDETKKWMAFKMEEIENAQKAKAETN